VTPDEPTPLETEIRERIAREGPIPVEAFMNMCLYDPAHGYYSRRPAFGAAGDFITAPEISQMFGELLGLWAATVWHSLGEPDPVLLIELGPGRGTMMADALRAACAVPAFHKALRVHLVETSVDLQMRQRQTLARVDDVTLRWHMTLDEVPAGPAIILANEFFDALPVHQAERLATGWHARAVTLNAGGQLALTIMAEPLTDFEQYLPRSLGRGAIGDIFEWRADHFAADIARRVTDGGAALLIDYGHVRSAAGDTFQAVRSHRYASPFAQPGLTDLTAHVDFEALGRVAQQAGARVHGPIEQGALLKRLGIEARAAALQAQAGDEKRSAIASALERLTGSGYADMGKLFKALGLASPQVKELPGFAP
jgi:NADH dehydrogenase [ubiquinone] 1 alpha subcomplex assembly factor 7